MRSAQRSPESSSEPSEPYPRARSARKDRRAEAHVQTSKRGFPHPLSILLIVTVLVWVGTMFIPAGRYQLDNEGRPIAGSFQRIEAPLGFGERVQDLLLAPVNGLYGLRNAETGKIGPFGAGTLFGAAQVFVFILAIGGFMTVVFATGALNLGAQHHGHDHCQRSVFTYAVPRRVLASRGVCRAVISHRRDRRRGPGHDHRNHSG